MELSVSSETTFFNMKLQLEICPQLRTAREGKFKQNRVLTIEKMNGPKCLIGSQAANELIVQQNIRGVGVSLFPPSQGTILQDGMLYHP